LNSDGVIDFLDINAFVLYLSNFPVWQTTYAGCDAAYGDIDGNGVYPLVWRHQSLRDAVSDTRAAAAVRWAAVA